MSILSITFHCTDEHLESWKKYVDQTLTLMVDHLMEVHQYIFSEIESEMINEGKNYNLLLVFKDEILRNQFIENEMLNIEQRVQKEFGDHVMIFKTLLNPKKSKKTDFLQYNLE